MTLKLTLALVMAFITAVIVGKFYVPWLRKMKAGQEIKENGLMTGKSCARSRISA